MSTVKEVHKAAFEFVAESFVRKCAMSGDAIISPTRKRNITDARRVFYKILKSHFDMSYTVMGNIFSKDHSSIIASLKKHNDLYQIDKEYTMFYDEINRDVVLRIKINHVCSMRENELRLKAFQINEREMCHVMLKCFPTRMDAMSFLKEEGVQSGHVVFQGQPENINSTIASQVVSSDEKRYMLDLMKRNTDPVLSMLNTELDRYYNDYTIDEFTIKNDPEKSFHTAVKTFKHNEIALIYIRVV